MRSASLYFERLICTNLCIPAEINRFSQVEWLLMKEKRFGLGRYQTSFSQETHSQTQLKMLRVPKGGYVKGDEETVVSLEMAGW